MKMNACLRATLVAMAFAALAGACGGDDSSGNNWNGSGSGSGGGSGAASPDGGTGSSSGGGTSSSGASSSSSGGGTTSSSSGGGTSSSGASSSSSGGGSTSGGDGGPIAVSAFTIDTPNVVRRSNVVLGKANVAPQDAMALGNGTLGAAVWAANGFTAQLNRGADTFPDRKAVGQVVIPGLAQLTGAADFSGHVDLYDATLTESGAGMTANVYIRADAPEMVVDVTGADPASNQTVKIGLWSGRSPSATASSTVATLAETWQDSGMYGSGQTFGVLSGVTVGGRNVQASVVDPLTIQVAFQPNQDGSFRVVIAAPPWTGGDAMKTATGVLGSDATAPSDALRAAHLAWWHSYWGRVGLLEMTSTDGTADYFENLRTLYLYIAAAESGGDFPGSQAGLAGFFDYLQDKQPWYPAGYWVWNLRMQVAANMSSGAFDLNKPFFNLYQSNVANIQAWTTSKMGGKPGICLPETMRFNGNGSWYNGDGNSSCNQGASPSYNALTITSGAEVGLWIWQHYQMTGDSAFLQTNYPVMSEAAKFLLAYATQGSDGLLHTVANAHETQWNVQDPVTDIVAMQALFQAVVSAAGVLSTDASLVAQLKDALTKLPPMPRTDASSHMQLLGPSDDAAGQDVIGFSYEPTAMRHNGENLDLEAVWPYGLIGDADANTELAKRTYAHRLFQNNPDWSFDAVQAARLGLADEVAKDLTSITQNYQKFVSGLGLLGGGTNDGTNEPYVEQLGGVALALDEAFVQDYDGLLRIAPAWPQGWDGAGTVYIQGSSRVDVQVKGGSVTMAVVEAGSTGSMNVRNPWPGQSTVVIDGASNAPVMMATSAATFMLPTTAGHWYAIVPASAANALPMVNVTGSPATSRKTFGPVSIGL